MFVHVQRIELLGTAQVGRYGGLEEEVEHLKRDKNVLMLELVRLRQQQQVLSHFLMHICA